MDGISKKNNFLHWAFTLREILLPCRPERRTVAAAAVQLSSQHYRCIRAAFSILSILQRLVDRTWLRAKLSCPAALLLLNVPWSRPTLCSHLAWSSIQNSRTHDRLRGIGSTMLTATAQVAGDRLILDHSQNQNLWTHRQRIWQLIMSARWLCQISCKSVNAERGVFGKCVKCDEFFDIPIYTHARIDTQKMPDYFYNNFGECGPIFIILSVADFQINCRESWINSTTSHQICCCTTLRKLNVQLCNYTARYSMQIWCKVVYVHYLFTRDVMFCSICQKKLIYIVAACVKIACPVGFCALSRARDWSMVNHC